MTDQSEVLPPQSSNPAYIVRQRISPFNDAFSDLLTKQGQAPYNCTS